MAGATAPAAARKARRSTACRFELPARERFGGPRWAQLHPRRRPRDSARGHRGAASARSRRNRAGGRGRPCRARGARIDRRRSERRAASERCGRRPLRPDRSRLVYDAQDGRAAHRSRTKCWQKAMRGLPPMSGTAPAPPSSWRGNARRAQAKLGLWGEPYYAIVAAESWAELLAERGRFTVVEGKVLSVRESGGTIYMNFGRRWSQALTVTISKRHERTSPPPGSSRRSWRTAGAGARMDRGAQRPADRGHPPRADRDRRTQLTKRKIEPRGRQSSTNRARSPDGAPATSGAAVPHFAALCGLQACARRAARARTGSCSSTLLCPSCRRPRPARCKPGSRAAAGRPARAPAHPRRLQRRLRGSQARSRAQPDGGKAGRRIRAAGHAAIVSPSSIRRRSTPSRCRAASST